MAREGTAHRGRAADACTLSARLYVAGDAPNSIAARANLSAVLASLGSQDANVVIVDVFDRPDLALEDRVYVTPILVRLGPLPECRIVGRLSDRGAVLQLLGVDKLPSKA